MRHNKILFSIIVPIYKVEKYLKECIDSILNQTYDNFEIILVDDGSPDNSPIICDQYAQKDNRIVVIHKNNGGLVEARKTGAAKAIGEYILCVDGDDWIELTYLQEFADIISQHAPDIICCGYLSAYIDHKVERPLTVPWGFYDKDKIKKIIFPYLIEDEKGRYFRPQLWAKAYRRDLYQQQQQQVSRLVSVGEDHACTKPCIFNAKSMYIYGSCLYNYRQNPESMTNKAKSFSWDGPISIGRHFERQIDMTQYDFQVQVYRNVVHNLFNVAVSQFNRSESYCLIKEDILMHINDPYYRQAIEGCWYKGNWKGTLAKYALKYKLIVLICLFNKTKK